MTAEREDDDLLRHARHQLLERFGPEGQSRVAEAHAVIVGAGGLGSYASLALGMAGVGQLTVFDPDRVERSNLARQVAHTEAWLGQHKVASLQQAIAARNPYVVFHARDESADEARLDAVLPTADVLIDCTDRWAIRHSLNRASRRHRVPLVMGSALAWSGQWAVFDPREPAAACYACAYPPGAQVPDADCATLGVLAPLVGVIGQAQAVASLRLLLGRREAHTTLWLAEADPLSFHALQLPRRADCPVCGASPTP